MTAEHWPSVAGMPIGWGAILGMVQLLFGGGVVAAWIANRPKMRSIQTDADAKLRDDLIRRVELLESKLDAERLRHEKEVAILRHRANDADQCIDALLLLLESEDNLSDRLKRGLALARDMRARQRQEQALEKGAARGAAVAAVIPITD